MGWYRKNNIMKKIRIMLDTSAYNVIAADEKFNNLLETAKGKGLIEAVTTHVQIDQINNTPKSSKKDSMIKVVNSDGTAVTLGYFPGISREGWFNPGYEDRLNLFLNKKETVDNIDKHKKDALIGSTSLDFDIFVTEDRSQGKTYKSINCLKFKIFLEKLLGKTTPDRNGSAGKPQNA